MNRKKIVRQLIQAARILEGGTTISAGYTHYWSAKKNTAFDEDEWAAITEGTKRIIAKAEKDGVSIRGSGGKGRPVISADLIHLNGDASKDESHEDFVIEEAPTVLSEFCKTNEKPYDAVVVSILALIMKVAPGFLKISSDGGMGIFRNPPYRP